MHSLWPQYGNWLVRALALLVVAPPANLALASQIADPGAIAIVVSANLLGQYGPYGRPMTEYRCTTCGQRF
ncbi:MAG: hypothetical protein MI757_03130, partial [Pirellulales bacterium]|nr:hypothetical protein [Pirellulales bacterium]